MAGEEVEASKGVAAEEQVDRTDLTTVNNTQNRHKTTVAGSQTGSLDLVSEDKAVENLGTEVIDPWGHLDSREHI